MGQPLTNANGVDANMDTGIGMNHTTWKTRFVGMCQVGGQQACEP